MINENVNYMRTGEAEAMRESVNETAGKQYVSSEVRFYTVNDVAEITGWSRKVVLRLFNDPEFPSANYGKAQIVEAHALIGFFSRKRMREQEYHWKKGELRDELTKRVR